MTRSFKELVERLAAADPDFAAAPGREGAGDEGDRVARMVRTDAVTPTPSGVMRFGHSSGV